eukprot:GHVT01039576.1.p1 GENE.GHVT01039576.1~~GHVT01039576.1.p1  ORF type:complete len:448 (-),score=52.29 GHVT01039576.1:302-1645(-)
MDVSITGASVEMPKGSGAARRGPAYPFTSPSIPKRAQQFSRQPGKTETSMSSATVPPAMHRTHKIREVSVDLPVDSDRRKLGLADRNGQTNRPPQELSRRSKAQRPLPVTSSVRCVARCSLPTDCKDSQHAAGMRQLAQLRAAALHLVKSPGSPNSETTTSGSDISTPSSWMSSNSSISTDSESCTASSRSSTSLCSTSHASSCRRYCSRKPHCCKDTRHMLDCRCYSPLSKRRCCHCLCSQCSRFVGGAERPASSCHNESKRLASSTSSSAIPVSTESSAAGSAMPSIPTALRGHFPGTERRPVTSSATGMPALVTAHCVAADDASGATSGNHPHTVTLTCPPPTVIINQTLPPPQQTPIELQQWMQSLGPLPKALPPRHEVATQTQRVAAQVTRFKGAAFLQQQSDPMIFSNRDDIQNVGLRKYLSCQSAKKKCASEQKSMQRPV